jgi:hypothetical protein
MYKAHWSLWFTDEARLLHGMGVEEGRKTALGNDVKMLLWDFLLLELHRDRL